MRKNIGDDGEFQEECIRMDSTIFWKWVIEKMVQGIIIVRYCKGE